MDLPIHPMTWPERPTCHGEMSPTFRTPIAWRGPQDLEDGPYVETFRTCSYCGSIHPEDLLRVVEAGATLGGSDWKYGWPHKFYVEGIPNPVAGQPRRAGGAYLGALSRDKTLEQVQTEYPGYSNWRNEPEGWRGDMISPGPATQGAKWYNDHLLDLSADAFEVVSRVLFEKTKIQFLIQGGDLRFHAPHRGYQA